MPGYFISVKPHHAVSVAVCSAAYKMFCQENVSLLEMKNPPDKTTAICMLIQHIFCTSQLLHIRAEPIVPTVLFRINCCMALYTQTGAQQA